MRTLRSMLTPWESLHYDALMLMEELECITADDQTLTEWHNQVTNLQQESDKKPVDQQDGESPQAYQVRLQQSLASTDLHISLDRKIALAKRLKAGLEAGYDADFIKSRLKMVLDKIKPTTTEYLTDNRSAIENEHNKHKHIFAIGNLQHKARVYYGAALPLAGIALLLLNAFTIGEHPASFKLCFGSFLTILSTLAVMGTAFYVFSYWYQYRNMPKLDNAEGAKKQPFLLQWDCGVMPVIGVGALSAGAYAYFVCTNSGDIWVAAGIGAAAGALGGLLLDSFIRSEKTFTSLPHVLNMAVNAIVAGGAMMGAQSLTSYFASTELLSGIDWRMTLLVDLCVVSSVLYVVKGLLNPLYQAVADKEF